MKNTTPRLHASLLLLVITALALGPAFADPPPWAGGNKGEAKDNREHQDKQNNSRNDNRDGDRRDGDKHSRDQHNESIRVNGYFGDQHRETVHKYYEDEYHKGHCPPGLAKKHNGCLPPGQAKKWSVGHPLPSDVRYYSVPNSLVVQIGRPPSGYRYVRVASDILLIAVGSNMVIDAIQDLGGR